MLLGCVPRRVEYAIRGSVAGGPRLELDHEQFAYAGKFDTERTGKALAYDDASTGPAGRAILGAASFNGDRAAPDTARIRYVTVRRDRRGEGIGSALLAAAGRVLSERHDRVAIAVNNPVAYRACYTAGFAFTGEETGLAELRMAHGGDRSAERYEAGLDRFRDRDLPADQRAVLDSELPEQQVPDTVIDDAYSDDR